MMEKMKNAMKNGLVNGSCDSFGATSVGSSSDRSRSGSDEARTATGRAGRAWRAVGGARGGAEGGRGTREQCESHLHAACARGTGASRRCVRLPRSNTCDPQYFKLCSHQTDGAMRHACGALLNEF